MNSQFLILIILFIQATFQITNDEYLSYYSDTFSESYTKFKTICQSKGHFYEEFQHTIKGKFNENLYTSVCISKEIINLNNSDESNLFYTHSGTHGVEGYAGAASQIYMLTHPEEFKFPKNTFFIHVHMINPYGASFYLKENELNVDLLKNVNQQYIGSSRNYVLEEFIDGLNISYINLPEVQQKAMIHFQNIMIKYGNNFTEATKYGQTTRQIGIAYQGVDKSWSLYQVEKIVDKYVKNTYKKGSKRKIVFLDLHTAVGDFGKIYVMNIRNENSFENKMMKEYFNLTTYLTDIVSDK
jgi:hypothetical protein